LAEELKVEGANFADVMQGASKTCLDKFTEGAKEAVVEESDEWNWKEELILLEEEMHSVGDQFRKDETKKMVNTIEVLSNGFPMNYYEC
jgi:protein SEY1